MNCVCECDGDINDEKGTRRDSCKAYKITFHDLGTIVVFDEIDPHYYIVTFQ